LSSAALPKSTGELVAEAGAIAPLVKLLGGEKGQEAQEEAASALFAIADHAANRLAITDAGGIAPLVNLLGSTNPKAREHAEGALVRLSIEHANRALIIKKLVEMLQNPDALLGQEQAC
jgi:HEAT repeat protein